MARLCEITRKRAPHPRNQEGGPQKRPDLLKRKVELKELNRTIRLWISAKGLEQVKAKGGLGAFLVDAQDKKLSKKLKSIRAQLPAVKKKLEAEQKAAAKAGDVPENPAPQAPAAQTKAG